MTDIILKLYSYNCFALYPLYIFLAFKPVTIVELLGNADTPPYIVSVSESEKKVVWFFHKILGSNNK